MPTAKNSGNRIIKITPLHLSGPDAAELSFPTIITQYADAWTPQWREEFVYGRMDPVSFYGGTDRKLTLGFRVISESPPEARTNMESIQRLIRWQYPTYMNHGAISTIQAPPYFKLSFFNLTSIGAESVQGYLKAPISITPGFQDKTKSQYYDKNYSKLLFSDVEIVLQMVVLHQKKVGFYGEGFGAPTARLPAYPYNIAPPNRSGEQAHSAIGAPALASLEQKNSDPKVQAALERVLGPQKE